MAEMPERYAVTGAMATTGATAVTPAGSVVEPVTVAMARMSAVRIHAMAAMAVGPVVTATAAMAATAQPAEMVVTGVPVVC